MTAKRLLREAAWAPIAVLAINFLVVRTPYAPHLFTPLHFLGGAALAFFFAQLLHIGGHRFGRLTPLTSYLASFALACTVAILWEIGEFLWDELFGTALQEGLADTMVDLIFSALGAAVALPLIALFRRETGRR